MKLLRTQRAKSTVTHVLMYKLQYFLAAIRVLSCYFRGDNLVADTHSFSLNQACFCHLFNQSINHGKGRSGRGG